MRRYAVMFGSLLIAVPLVTVPAHAAAPPPSPKPPAAGATVPSPTAVTPKAVQPAARPGPIPPLSPVDPGPNGSARVPNTASPALQPIAALPPIDTGAQSPDVPRAPVEQQLPVRPARVTLPTQPGQTLIDRTAADAQATIAASGVHGLDATQLQPQVGSAQFGDPAQLANLQQLIDALTSGDLPPDLPVDPLALLQALPDGIPRITYRVCSQSASKPVSCTITLPLGVPALVNVTGDHTPDELVDLLPMVSLESIVAAVTTLLDDQSLLDAANQRLQTLLQLLQDPLYLLTHPDALLRLADLRDLVDTLTGTVQRDLDALLSLVNVGLALLQIRLPTSEIPSGTPIQAHLFAVYDVPGHHRLSLGMDGLNRGAGLPTASLGIFSFNPARLLAGVYDVRAEYLLAGAPDSLAITAGFASVAQDQAGTPQDPTVLSARFSPVPASFSAHAVIDPGAEVDARSSRETHLDAIVLSNRHLQDPPTDQFTELKVDTLPTTVAAELDRPAGGGAAHLSYQAASTIDQALFANFTYSGTTLLNAFQALAKQIPTDITLDLKPDGDALHADYTASSVLASLVAAFYDHASTISGVTGPLVLRGSLTSLPTSLTGLFDRAARHVSLVADRPLGRATLDISFDRGAYAPIDGDHVTFIRAGNPFGVSAAISGLQKVDAFYDAHPRVSTAFDPGGQAFTAAAIVDDRVKVRFDATNLPASMSLDIDPSARTLSYQASEVVHRVSGSFVDLQSGPSVFAAVNELPKSVTGRWDLGPAPRVHYEASSVVPRAELFASPSGIETVNPDADQYLSVAVTGIPATVDVLIDFPNRHVEGDSSAAIGSIAAAARFPLEGRDFTATGSLRDVPAKFTVDFKDGNYDFTAASGPLGAVDFTVSNHPRPVEPSAPVHLGVHFNQRTGDLDGSISVLDLSHVAYTHDGNGQHFTLRADEGGNALAVDIGVVLAANGVDDTQLSALGTITGLPSTLDITYTGGKLTYTADTHVGIELNVRLGKVAALSGLGAPLPDNGVAVVARGCAAGAGCASDDSVFCATFGTCLGLVGNINVSGLPTSVVVDAGAGTISFTGYQPPAAPLVVLLRLIGLLPAFPDLTARATLSDLPPTLDLTVGPVTFKAGDPSSVDVQYHASAPLGTLRVDADATTTNATFPVLRARAIAAGLPATLHVTGSFGSTTHVIVADSSAITSISATLTNAISGYLDARIDHVPASVDYLLDVPNAHTEATMSSPIDSITVLAHVPVGGRTWSALADVSGIPGKFSADFAAGNYRFRGESGPLGAATFAVTNHAGATVPDLAHYLAVHYDQASGDADAGAAISDLSSVSYAKDAAGNQAFSLDMGATTVALDANLVFTAGGARDTRYSAGGTVTTPNTVHVDLTGGHLVYRTDRRVALHLDAQVGKVAALAGLGAPLYPQGVAVRAVGCSGGAGCASDDGPFCGVFPGRCFGAAATVSLPGAPTKVDVDPKARTIEIDGLASSGDLKAFVELRGLIDALPRARALLTLSGLPATLNLTAGPFGIDADHPNAIVARYTANAPLGRLQIDADAQTTASFGEIRAQAIADQLPSSVNLTGTFGSRTHVNVDDGAAINTLRLEATALIQGAPASALVSIGDVPASADLVVAGFGNDQGVNVPTITYTSPASTLDGLVQLDGQFVANVGPAGVGSNGAYAEFTDLGGSTTVKINQDASVSMASTPATASLQFGANLQVGAIARHDVDKVLFSKVGGFFTGRLQGHFGMDASSIDDIDVVATGLSTISLQPGIAPFNLPPAAGLIFPGLSGTYDSFSMFTNGVDLRPDVDLTFRVDRAIGPDVFKQEAVLGPTNTIRFHRYDNKGSGEISSRFQLSALGVDLGCLAVSTKPELAGLSTNGVTLHGSDGPQTFTFLDPGGQVPAYVVDLTAVATSPFPDTSVSGSLVGRSC